MRTIPSRQRCEQLKLFASPAAAAPSWWRRLTLLVTGHRALRTVLTLLAVGVATTGIMSGSWAAWTAQTTNASNSVTAGTLGLTNSRDATWVFQSSGVVPDDTGTGTVTLANAGSVPLRVTLTQDQRSSTGIEASLGLKVWDQTRNHCYWPVNAAGACPAGYGAWNATALSALELASTTGASRWPAGETHVFQISWQLAPTSVNADQGKTGSFRLVWDGTQ